LVPLAHDAYTRLTHRENPDPQTLYNEVEPLIKKHDGVIALDDSMLDHFYAKKMPLVQRHWSGKHKRVVWGIDLISLIWSDGDRTVPVDYWVLDKPIDDLTKNDHFQAMISMANRRGFAPQAVLFDSWYWGLANLKLIRDCGWVFLTQLKVNRAVDSERQGYQPVSDSASVWPCLATWATFSSSQMNGWCPTLIEQRGG